MAGEYYEIRVEGHLDAAWEGWLGGMAIRREPTGETILYGLVADQAALHGVLAWIRDLNLRLIGVNSQERKETPFPEDQQKRGE